MLTPANRPRYMDRVAMQETLPVTVGVQIVFEGYAYGWRWSALFRGRPVDMGHDIETNGHRGYKSLAAAQKVARRHVRQWAKEV